jgi:hypothetical protein
MRSYYLLGFAVVADIIVLSLVLLLIPGYFGWAAIGAFFAFLVALFTIGGRPRGYGAGEGPGISNE